MRSDEQPPSDLMLSSGPRRLNAPYKIPDSEMQSPELLLIPVVIVGLFVVYVVVPIVLFRIARNKIRQWRRFKSRRHLYVKVTATVQRAWISKNFATVWFTYDRRGTPIHYRLTVSIDLGWDARKRRTIDLLVDPDFPYDVVTPE